MFRKPTEDEMEDYRQQAAEEMAGCICRSHPLACPIHPIIDISDEEVSGDE